MSASLRAPQADGAILAVPSFEQVDSLITHNRRLFDRPLAELRAQARREALQAAQSYFAEAEEDVPAPSGDSLVLAGHQPELFHPGVWIKNFALNRIARQSGATPLVLIVDNDTVKSTSLHLPVRRGEVWRRLQLPFDFHGPDIPYEERTVVNEEVFASFAGQAAETTSTWNFKPILGEFWDRVLEHRSRTRLVGERFAAARRCLERRWGCHNLEVPVSRLCSSESFSWFVTQVLGNLAEFHSTHDEVVRDYRHLHRLRSRNHPVPDLAQENDWLEAPFWVWRSGDARRSRPFVRTANKAVQLRAGNETLPPTSPSSVLRELASRGLKLRPRALTTTLFARLLLADLFIHGIGGAKYDVLTDELLRRFFGIEPPGFMTLSATLLLPFDVSPVDKNYCAGLDRQVRDLWFNPQRHVSASADAAARALAHEKEQWIRQMPAPGTGKKRHEELSELSAKLRPFTAAQRERLEKQAQHCRERLESQEIRLRRDYSFCLYPEEKLRPFCQQFL